MCSWGSGISLGQKMPLAESATSSSRALLLAEMCLGFRTLYTSEGDGGTQVRSSVPRAVLERRTDNA